MFNPGPTIIEYPIAGGQNCLVINDALIDPGQRHMPPRTDPMQRRPTLKEFLVCRNKL